MKLISLHKSAKIINSCSGSDMNKTPIRRKAPQWKQRPNKSSQNTTFKSKLRFNIGILEKLKEPQVLKRLWLEEQVPTSLLRPRAIKTNKVASDQYKDIISSTPHFTKNEKDIFFNNTGSSFLSPIKSNSVRHSTDSDGNKAYNVNCSGKRDSSVIYVGTKAADRGDPPYMLAPKDRTNQNQETSRRRSLRSRSGKSTNADDIQHDSQLAKKSRNPSRTKSQEKGVAKLPNGNNSYKSKAVDHPLVTGTAPNQRAKSKKRARSKSKEETNLNNTPVKQPNKQLAYTTRSSTKVQEENDAEDIHVSKKVSIRQMSVSCKSIKSKRSSSLKINDVEANPCTDNDELVEVNKSLEHDRTKFVNKTPRREENRTPRNKGSDNLMTPEHDRTKFVNKTPRREENRTPRNKGSDNLMTPEQQLHLNAINLSCNSGAKTTSNKPGSDVSRTLNNKNTRTRNIPELVQAKTNEVPESVTEEPKPLHILLEEIQSRRAENLTLGEDIQTLGANVGSNVPASMAHSKGMRFDQIQAGYRGRQDKNDGNNSTVAKTPNTKHQRSPRKLHKNQAEGSESPIPLVELMNEIESRKANTLAKNTHPPTLCTSVAVADIEVDNDNSNQNTLTNNIAIDDQDRSASLHSIIDDIKSRASRAVTKAGRQSKTVNTAFQNTSVLSLFSKEGNIERKSRFDSMMMKLENLAREAELQRTGPDGSKSRGHVIGRSYPFVIAALTPTERRLSLHNVIEKIQPLSSNAKAKNMPQTVNKQIQTSNVLDKSHSTSRPPVFRRSAIRSGWKHRSSRKITVLGSNSSSSYASSVTVERPNIFDSLNEGNELDAINFSDEDDPAFSFIVKPWRFVNDNAPQEESENVSLNFIRSEAQLQSSSEIVSKRSENSLNDRTLTGENCSPLENSSTSERSFPIVLRSTIKQYVGKQAKVADKRSLAVTDKHCMSDVSKNSNREINRDIPTVNTSVTRDLDEKSVVNNTAGTGSGRHSKKSNCNLPHSTRKWIGSSRNVGTNNMMQQTSFRENNINETHRKRQELVDKQTSPIKNSPTKNNAKCVSRELFVNLEKSSANSKPSFERITHSDTNNEEEIDSSASTKRKDSGKIKSNKGTKKSNTKKKDVIQALESHNSLSVRLSDVSRMTSITEKHNSEDNSNNKFLENEESRSSLQQVASRTEVTTINEPLVEAVDNMPKSHFSPVKSRSGERQSSQRNTDIQQARAANDDVATIHPSPSKNASKEKVIKTRDRRAKSSHRNTDLHQANDVTLRTHSSLAVNISKNIDKSKSQDDISKESFAKTAKDKTATFHPPLKKNNKGIGKRRGRKPKSSQINSDVAQDTINEPSTVNGIVTPSFISATPSITSVNLKPRITRSLLHVVDVSNILQTEDGRRPQRTRRPVKFHTDLNLEELGLIPIDLYQGGVRRIRKLSVIKGKENKKKKINITEVSNVVPEEPVSEVQDTPNERKGQNVAASEQDNINSAAVGSQQVEEAQPMDTQIMPAPRISIRTHRDLTADSGYVNSKSNDTGRVTTFRKSPVRKTRRDDNNLTNINNMGNEESASLLQPRPSQAEEITNEGHFEQDTMDMCSGMLDRASNFSSYIAPRLGPSETAFAANETNCNGDRGLSRDTDDHFIRHVVGGDVYNLRYICRKPTDNLFRKLGNLSVCEMTNDPENRFSSGYLRLDAGDHKRRTTGHKFSFIFNVVSGSVQVCLADKMGTADEGDFFYIPRGMEYSIKNLDSQRHLLLSYTRLKGGDL